MFGDDPTHEICRPKLSRGRFHDIAEDVKVTALTVGSVIWLAASVVALVGFLRLAEKIW